jgi:chromosome segregation ATPase
MKKVIFFVMGIAMFNDCLLSMEKASRRTSKTMSFSDASDDVETELTKLRSELEIARGTIVSLQSEIEKLQQSVAYRQVTIEKQQQHIIELEAYIRSAKRSSDSTSSTTSQASKRKKKAWSPEKAWEDQIVKNSYSSGVRVPQSNLVGQSNPQSAYYHPTN